MNVGSRGREFRECPKEPGVVMNRVGIRRVTLEQVYMMGIGSSMLWDLVKRSKVKVMQIADDSEEYWLAVRAEHDGLATLL